MLPVRYSPDDPARHSLLRWDSIRIAVRKPNERINATHDLNPELHASSGPDSRVALRRPRTSSSPKCRLIQRRIPSSRWARFLDQQELVLQIDSGRTKEPRECVISSMSKGSAAWDQSYARESALKVLRPAMMAVTWCAARVCRSGEHPALTV